MTRKLRTHALAAPQTRAHDPPESLDKLVATRYRTDNTEQL